MRIRTVKPEFWSHPVMTRLPYDTRLLALALLNLADDEGYFYADAELVRGGVMPREETQNVKRMLEQLADGGEDAWISVEPTKLFGLIGRVNGFTKHQRIDKPQASKIRPHWPKKEAFQDDSKNVPRTIQDDSQMEGNGKEWNGKEGIIPLNGSSGEEDGGGRFVPPTEGEVENRCCEIGLPVSEGRKFMDYYESKGWMVGKTKMQKWRSALSGWKNRWEETRGRQSRGCVTSAEEAILREIRSI